MVTQETFTHWIRMSKTTFYSIPRHYYHLRVLEIDVKSRLVSGVAQNSVGNALWSLQATVSDGKSIHFRSFELEEGVLEYYMEENRWSSFPFHGSFPTGLSCWSLNLQLGKRGYDPFLPGLNTFAVV